jgi:hypothetical protein
MAPPGNVAIRRPSPPTSRFDWKTTWSPAGLGDGIASVPAFATSLTCSAALPSGRMRHAVF